VQIQEMEAREQEIRSQVFEEQMKKGGYLDGSQNYPAELGVNRVHEVEDSQRVHEVSG
jgi:hypothetical protein